MNSNSKYLNLVHEQLQVVLKRLDPSLEQHGFRFHLEQNSISSGGVFSNGFYKRLPLQIGLIVRGSGLGSPVYFYKDYQASHDSLIKELNRTEESFLRFDNDYKNWKLFTIDGRDVLDAFIADLENIILPTMLDDLKLFNQAIISAHENRINKYL